MKLSDIDFSQIRIGQVVKFDHTQKYAYVCGLRGEVPGSTIRPRYDSVDVCHQNEKVSTGLFHPMWNDNMEVIDYVLSSKERMEWPNCIDTIKIEEDNYDIY